MFILQTTPECVPFAKTGGLADVVGGIVGPIEKLGHRVAVFMPFYRPVREARLALKKVAEVEVPLGPKRLAGTVWRGNVPGTEIPVFFIDQEELFNREGLYGGQKGDYADNAERYVFFSRAVLESIVALDLAVDVIHAHDWQTALIPVYLKTLYKEHPALREIRTLLTIHNTSYQGLFWHWDMALTGLDWSFFNWKQLEFWGKLSFLKGGIVFADGLTTVSPRYAREIQTAEFGCGLEGLLKDRAADLTGIVNGVNTEEWNPATDPLIPARYSAGDYSGKRACKAALRRQLGLPESEAPLFGVVSRFVEQKGIDVILGAVDEMASAGAQVVIVGTGDRAIERAVEDASRRSPRAVASRIGFDNRWAHEVIAGADAYFMPSRFEPCGLSQLYSLRYGTVPVVRRTGGLADTIEDGATGFTFADPTPASLLGAFRRAITVWKTPKAWAAMMAAGMKQDWSWSRGAAEYSALYAKLKRKK